MWRIYVVLALWSHPLNAQYGAYITNSRSGVYEGNSVKATEYYTDYSLNIPLPAANKNKTIDNLTQLSDRSFNKNVRDSIGYTDTSTLAENPLLSNGKEMQIKNIQYNDIKDRKKSSSTTSPLLNADSTSTQCPRTWKILKSNSFNARLFDIMSTKAQNENLVYSPISLQTLLAFIFNMSEGKLYAELAQLLAISANRTYVVKVFEDVLQKSLSETPSTTLIMANKLYYNNRLGPIDASVRNFAKKSFDSEIEQVNFLDSKKAANIINSWVSTKTRNLIKDIVSSSSISGETSALLLNAIYFKSEWLTKFASHDTETQDFFMTQQTKVPVDMMYNEDVFRYGDFFEDLRASIVELPYKNSNLSMLLILPHDIEGLQSLERKLRNYDLQSLSQKLKREIVTVKLPRFKVEYESNMIATLQEMGLNALFNNAGGIHLFKNQQTPLKIDQFKHKSFIGVNEVGTVAAATSVAKYVPLSIPTEMKYFVADHPFLFVIQDTNSTFFMGHVVKF